MYSNVFNWTNITLENLILILNNLDHLRNNDNFKIVYELSFESEKIYKSKNIDDIKKYYLDNPKKYRVHIDYEFYIDLKFIYWSHGIVEDNIENFINCSLNTYEQIILNKINYLVEHTFIILNNNTDIIKIYIKCLKDEYTLDLFTNLENIFNRPNIYIGIIYESDSDIDIQTKNTNTVLLRCNKLTGHHEAVFSKLYNTQEKYFTLFEAIDRLSKS